MSAEVNEEGNIVIEDEVKEEPVKLTPEEAKLLEDTKVKKMNKTAKAKYQAKKYAKAEVEKIKAELAVAAEKAKEDQMRAAKLKKQEEAKAKRDAKLDKLTAASMAATKRRLGFGQIYYFLPL